GEFWAGEDSAKETQVLATALLRRPAEIVVPDSVREDPALLARLQDTGAALTFCDPLTFAPRRAVADLCAHFRVESLAAFGVGDLTAGLGAAAAALAYLRATQGDALGHLTRLQRLTATDAMILDETAVVTLELLTSSGGSTRESLFGVLDETVTPVGAPPLAPVAPAAASRSRGDRGAPARRRGAGRRAGRADASGHHAAPDRRPRTADEPGHSGPGTRAGPGRPARMPGPAARDPNAGRVDRRDRDRRRGR